MTIDNLTLLVDFMINKFLRKNEKVLALVLFSLVIILATSLIYIWWQALNNDTSPKPGDFIKSGVPVVNSNRTLQPVGSESSKPSPSK